MAEKTKRKKATKRQQAVEEITKKQKAAEEEKLPDRPRAWFNPYDSAISKRIDMERQLAKNVSDAKLNLENTTNRVYHNWSGSYRNTVTSGDDDIKYATRKLEQAVKAKNDFRGGRRRKHTHKRRKSTRSR
jgi:hypothetical protein